MAARAIASGAEIAAEDLTWKRPAHGISPRFFDEVVRPSRPSSNRGGHHHRLVDGRVKVVLTGGAGFIGSHLASLLVSQGETVHVIDDLSTGRADSLPAGVELHVIDVADTRVIGVIEDVRPDIVIHGAAQVSVARSMEDPDLDERINVAGTKHVVIGAARAGARRVVFLSSGGAVYGETDGATESSSPAPKSPYGRNKLRAEAIVASSAASFAVARLSNVYGPGQRADLEGGVVAIFASALTARQGITIYGDGHQRRDLVYVDDVASAIVRLADGSLNGTWNVATGNPARCSTC